MLVSGSQMTLVTLLFARLSELLRCLLRGSACCQQPAQIRRSGRLLSFSSPLALLLGFAAALLQWHQLLHWRKGRPDGLYRSAQEGQLCWCQSLSDPVRMGGPESTLILVLAPVGGWRHPAHPPAGDSDCEGDPADVPSVSPPPRVQRRGRSSGRLVQTSGVEG